MAGVLQGSVTRLLDQIRTGSADAKSQLFQLVYSELRQIAGGLMQQERPDHTLQPTALVHEAIVRILGADALHKAPNRAYFFAAATRAMRQILVEHARSRATSKRGNGRERVPLDEALHYFEEKHLDVLALHEAMDVLASLDERQCQIVELRFFGGFTVQEVAEQLGISVTTVESDFRKARAFLRQRLIGHDGPVEIPDPQKVAR